MGLGNNLFDISNGLRGGFSAEKHVDESCFCQFYTVQHLVPNIIIMCNIIRRGERGGGFFLLYPIKKETKYDAEGVFVLSASILHKSNPTTPHPLVSNHSLF